MTLPKEFEDRLAAAVAAAREEQREADAKFCPNCLGVGFVERPVPCPFCDDSTHDHYCPTGTQRQQCGCGAERIRATPLTATPLADRIAELEQHETALAQSLEQMTARVSDVEAERDALDKLRHDYKCALERSDTDLMTARSERDRDERDRRPYTAQFGGNRIPPRPPFEGQPGLEAAVRAATTPEEARAIVEEHYRRQVLHVDPTQPETRVGAFLGLPPVTFSGTIVAVQFAVDANTVTAGTEVLLDDGRRYELQQVDGALQWVAVPAERSEDDVTPPASPPPAR